MLLLPLPLAHLNRPPQPLPLQTPLIMTAIQTNSKSIFIGPGIWMSCMAVVSIVSCLIMLKKFPAANK
jgi:hypothetical protein